MDSLLFLLLPVVVIVLGTTVVFIRSREPKGHDRGIRSFKREMQALSPGSARKSLAGEGIDASASVDPLLGPTIVPRPVDPVEPDSASTGE